MIDILIDDSLEVPTQNNCLTSRIENGSFIDISGNDVTVLEMVPSYSCSKWVERLEHVIIKVSINNGFRGQLKLTLISPAARESIILDKRPNDDSKDGFQEFEFLSVHFWDEIVENDKSWQLKIENLANEEGYVSLLDLILFGTSQE